jgi:hypothetical protein
MKPKHKKSAAEIRRGQIALQLERLRSRLASINSSQYADERTYRRELGRTHELISELEGELSMLDCPGEYAELPAAVVADELGLSREQVRGLVRLGEIVATGRAAHERIPRRELEQITTVGPTELLRRGREESSEIFQQAVPCLQAGDLEAAERAYRRLEARLSWRGPYAPAFLVGLELAKGDLDGGLSSVRLIYEHEDLLQKMAVMSYLRRVLGDLRLNDAGAQELCGRILALADQGVDPGRVREGAKRKRPKAQDLNHIQWQAAYLSTSIMVELRRHTRLKPYADSLALEQEVGPVIRDTLYTALYAEAFYDGDTSCRLYVDMMSGMIPKGQPPATVSEALNGKGGRAR